MRRSVASSLQAASQASCQCLDFDDCVADMPAQSMLAFAFGLDMAIPTCESAGRMTGVGAGQTGTVSPTADCQRENWLC